MSISFSLVLKKKTKIEKFCFENITDLLPINISNLLTYVKSDDSEFIYLVFSDLFEYRSMYQFTHMFPCLFFLINYDAAIFHVFQVQFCTCAVQKE